MRRALISSALVLAMPAGAVAQTTVEPAWSGPLPAAAVAQMTAAPAWSGPLPTTAAEPNPSEPKPVAAVAQTSPMPVWSGPLPVGAVAQTVAEPAPSGPQEAAAVAQTVADQASDVPPRNSGPSGPTQVAAADAPSSVSGFLHGADYEVGTRYFWSTGTMLKTLKNPSGSLINSRLTYSGLQANSGEVFGRVEFASGLFAKTVVGAGLNDQGNFKDEDLPPNTTPYSATNSSENGSLAYATVDLGWDFLARPDWQERVDRSLGLTKAHLGPFVGYSYYHEEANGYGCTQAATNTSICTPTISNSVKVITQDDDWSAVRVGAAGDVTILDRLTIGAEGAWLPAGSFSGSDSHWLRIGSATGDFNGSTPETGGVKGFETEATLSYRVTDGFSLNVGGRYWYMRSQATEHFEQSVIPVGSNPTQPVDRRDDRYGVFVGGSYSF